MNKKDELLDLVNENDEVIGTIFRSEKDAKNINDYRVINVFIVNSRGQLWIPRRTKNKILFPLGLDMSVGGHVPSGETYHEAFERETLEEVGINLNDIAWKLLGKVTPYKDKVNAFGQVYEIKMDNVPKYNENDFCEYFWLYPKEVIEKNNKGELMKSDLPKLVEIFYLS